MFRAIMRACTLSVALMCVCASPSLAHSDLPAGITVTPVTSHKLPHVAGKSITMVRVTLAPGSKDGAHRHAGAVTVYVLSGTVRTQIDDGPVATFKAGDTFFEAPGVVHSMIENPTTEPAEILAVFVADDGAELTTPIK